MPAIMERNEWVDTMAHASCAGRVWLETVRPKRNRITFSAPISHKDSAFRIVLIPLTDSEGRGFVSDSIEMDVLKSKIRALTAEYAADDWDGYGAKALDPKSRSAALRFVGKLPQSALSPDVCVDTDGEIYLEWKPRRGCYCSVTLSGDGRYHCLVKDGVRKTLCTTNVADEALAHVVRICA